MGSDYATILLAGRDPDLLLLRSAMLAASGMWSMRVRNTVQAIQVLEFVECALAVVCYTLEESERRKLTKVLLGRHKAIQVLQVSAGDDCCAFGFLRRVEEALHPSSPVSHQVLEPTQANSRMIR